MECGFMSDLKKPDLPPDLQDDDGFGITQTHCTYVYNETTGTFTLSDPCVDSHNNVVEKCPDPSASRVGNDGLIEEACFTNPVAHLWLVERGANGTTQGKAIYQVGTGQAEFVTLDGFTGSRDLDHVRIRKVQGQIKIVLACARTLHQNNCGMQAVPTETDGGT
jgi:hypothetical protein